MATKKAAESTLYHLSPKGFWKKLRAFLKHLYIQSWLFLFSVLGDNIAVNPGISSGLPIQGVHRFPPPASRPELYNTPATKGALYVTFPKIFMILMTLPASDPAENPYWKRDVRRAYPRLSVVTQNELSTLLIEHSSTQA